VGDFNEAMWSFEQFFSRKRSEKQMADFRHTLSHCEVHDLGFIGVPWTFDNKQQGGRNVKVILDNGVASEAGPAGSLCAPPSYLKIRPSTAFAGI
jgi:hypothetical protein